MSIVDDRSSVSSLPRKSVGGQIQAFGDRLKRGLSNERVVRGEQSQNEQERSLSRGRRGRDFKSSGRGGAGNIHAASYIDEGSYIDSVPVSGREVSESPARDFVSTGRGGSGNIRSPSSNPADARSQSTSRRTPHEDALIRESIVASQSHPHSSGRGGSGNVFVPSNDAKTPIPVRNTSNSRSPPSRMTGRGGAGNRQISSTLETYE